MAHACAHPDCEASIAITGGRYCEEHSVEFAAVLGMLDEMRHIPGETHE